MLKYRVKTIILVFTCLCLSIYCFAQDQIPASVFSTGQGVSSTNDMSLHSLVGQNVIGSSQRDSIVVHSGFFALPIIQTALLNDAPVIVSTSIDTAYQGQYYKYQVMAVDPDDSLLSFSFHNLPYGFVGQGDSVITFNVLQQVDTSFMAIVSDGSLADTLQVTLIISQQVKPFAITSPSLDTATEDEKYIYLPSSNYDNDTTVTIKYDFRYSFFPPWLSPVIGTNGRTSLVGTPLEGDTSTKFILKAINLADTTTPLAIKEINLMVQSVNDAPTITLPISLATTAGVEFQYQILANDVDDSLLHYTLLSAPVTMTVSPTGLLHSWIPAETLVGTVDTITIQVQDSHGAVVIGSFEIQIIAEGTPYCSNAGPIPLLSRDSIKIPISLVDKNFDSLSISVKYYLADGTSSAPINLLGKTIGIDSSNYNSTLIWVSQADFPNRVVDSVLIEIIPSDGVNTGPPFRTNWFSINNTTALTISSITPLITDTVTSYESRFITITFAGQTVDTHSLDPSTISINGSIGGPMAYTMIKSPTVVQCLLNEFPFGGEDITVTISGNVRDIYHKTLDGNQNGLFEGAGIDDYSSTYTIALPGDFDANDTLGGAVELSYLSSYWHGSASDSIKPDSIIQIEIGPALGIPPHLKLVADSLFNFADLCVYLQMWYWQTKSPNARIKGFFANRLASIYSQLDQKNNQVQVTKPKTLPINPDIPQYDPQSAKQRVIIQAGKANDIVLHMNVHQVSDLVSCEYRIYYDQTDMIYQGTEGKSLLDELSGNALILENTMTGFTQINMTRLAATHPAISGNGNAISLRFQKPGYAKGVVIDYILVNRNHEIIESGRIPLGEEFLNQNSPLSKSPITNFTCVPNPFMATTNPSQPRISDNSLFPAKALSSEAGTVITFTVPQGFMRNTKLSTNGQIDITLTIFDALGNTVFQSPKTTLYPQCKTKGESKTYTLYWNGTNRNNRILAPGIYPALLTWKTDLKSGILSSLLGIEADK